MTWAGEHGERFCSFQSPGLFFFLTLPFIERANRPLRYQNQPAGLPTLLFLGVELRVKSGSARHVHLNEYPIQRHSKS